MGKPIKHSTDAAVRRQEKSDSVEQAVTTDADIDVSHSVNDEFGYPLWAKPADQSNDGNTAGDVKSTSTDSDGDDSEGN